MLNPSGMAEWCWFPNHFSYPCLPVASLRTWQISMGSLSFKPGDSALNVSLTPALTSASHTPFLHTPGLHTTLPSECFSMPRESCWNSPSLLTTGRHFLFFHPSPLSVSSPAEPPEPWGEGFDKDIPFRTDYPKISYSLHTIPLWTSVWIIIYCSVNLLDDDWLRHWCMRIAECH